MLFDPFRNRLTIGQPYISISVSYCMVISERYYSIVNEFLPIIKPKLGLFL